MIRLQEENPGRKAKYFSGRLQRIRRQNEENLKDPVVYSIISICFIPLLIFHFLPSLGRKPLLNI